MTTVPSVSTLRRRADRAGFRLIQRDGLYGLTDHETGGTAMGFDVLGKPDATAADVRDYLNEMES